jgi:hypothetical protein
MRTRVLRTARAWVLAAASVLAGCDLLVGSDSHRLFPFSDAGGPASDGASGGGSSGATPSPDGATAASDASGDGPPRATDAASPPDDGPGDVAAEIETGSDASGQLDLIDDMSSDNGLILMTEGRNGAWFSYNDGTGTVTPAASTSILPVALAPPQTFPPWGPSQYAMRFFGSGFTRTGGGIGMYFLTPHGSYDASRFTGIQFWAKVGAAGDTGLLTVEFPSAKTVAAGGMCTVCNVNFKTTVALTTTWAAHTVPFAQAQQSATGVPHLSSLDSNELYGLDFEVGTNVTFDVYIGDVAFTLP